MNHEAVSKRYAKALFEIAVERKILDKISKDMEFVNGVMMASDQLLEWLLHPATDIDDKKQIFSTLFKKVNSATLHFLFVVIDNHREDVLTEIISYFQHLVYEEKGEVEAKITTAFPLEKGDKKQLMQTFQRLLGKEVVIKEVAVNSDLLGGVIVQIGDRIFDGSLQNKLKRFQERVKRTNVGI